MKGALSALLALWLMTPVQAQTPYPFVVSSCGGQTFTVGQSKPITMDTTGNLCTSAVGGGGSSTANQGTANTAANAWPVTLVIGGAVNAVGNPIFVSPGTGASFATTLASLPALATGSNTIGKVDILGNAGGTLDTAAGTAASTGFTVQGFGSAGTASGGVITAQGVASMTPFLVNPGTAANWSVGATGSAPPANATYLGASSGGNLTGLVSCGSHVFKHITSGTDTLLVQGVTSQTVKVCGFITNFSGSAAQSVYLENTASTNANCSSTLTQIGGLVTGNSSSPGSPGWYNPIWGGLANTSGNGLCVNSSGTGGVDVDLWYTLGS